MRVLVSGSRGFIGEALVAYLGGHGHEVVRLLRGGDAARYGEACWAPESGEVKGAEGVEAVVHLAGENIARRRWTVAQKTRIRDSRIKGTRQLVSRLRTLACPPRVFVCASAVGYYGDRGDELLDETSDAGTGFLADVCRDWEAEAGKAAELGTRVVMARFGAVLGPGGGALSKMMPAFRLGLGGPLGAGTQYVSWVALDDAVGAIGHLLETETLSGPVNVTSPEPVTNRTLSTALGVALRRPAVFPLPGFVARIVLGEMAGDVLLASQRVAPRRLIESGYRFVYPSVSEALEAALCTR